MSKVSDFIWRRKTSFIICCQFEVIRNKCCYHIGLLSDKCKTLAKFSIFSAVPNIDINHLYNNISFIGTDIMEKFTLQLKLFFLAYKDFHDIIFLFFFAFCEIERLFHFLFLSHFSLLSFVPINKLNFFSVISLSSISLSLLHLSLSLKKK